MKDETGQSNVNVERMRLLARSLTLRADIQQHFDDVTHWNDHGRSPDEAAIDPDPDGQLRRMADGLDRMLTAEGLSPSKGRHD